MGMYRNGVAFGVINIAVYLNRSKSDYEKDKFDSLWK